MLDISIDTWIEELDADRDLLLIHRFCISDEKEKRVAMLAAAVVLEEVAGKLVEEIEK